MEKEDSKLIANYLDGDENSFRALVLKYIKPIYGFSFRFTGNKNDSEDIVQNVFIKVWKNLKKYNKEQNFKTWIFTIARNTIFDYLRKKKEIVFTDLENEIGENEIINNLENAEISLEELASDKERIEKIKNCIKKLSKENQEILILRYENDFSFAEISEILEKPENTIKSIHRRAVLKIKELVNAPK